MHIRCSNLLTVISLLLSLSLPITSVATPITSSDLWDVSNGVVMDNTSGALYYSSGYRSDVHNMFGGTLGTIEVGNTLFKDYMSPGMSGGSVAPGYTHFVEWHTSGMVTLRSFTLHAYNEGMLRRAFNQFQLFAGDGGGNWTSIYDTGAGFSYGPGYLELAADITAVNAQYFRAEFVQAPYTDSRAVGPRIFELDGFNTFLDGTTGGTIPEPLTVFLLGLGLTGILISRKTLRP